MTETAFVPVAPALTSPAADAIRRRMTNPFLMRLYMLGKLPLALVAGVRLPVLDGRRAVATVPYGWRSTNPFQSTYFAALSMAAELSTGALALVAARSAGSSVAMLLVGLEANFEKKATSRTDFTCEDGEAIAAAVAQTVATGAPATVRATTVGRNAAGEVVARFAFTWSFKRRS